MPTAPVIQALGIGALLRTSPRVSGGGMAKTPDSIRSPRAARHRSHRCKEFSRNFIFTHHDAVHPDEDVKLRVVALVVFWSACPHPPPFGLLAPAGFHVRRSQILARATLLDIKTDVEGKIAKDVEYASEKTPLHCPKMGTRPSRPGISLASRRWKQGEAGGAS